MAGEEEQVLTCADCGATIYPEHLQKRVAEHWEGKLLCPYCLRDKRSGSAAGVAVEPLQGEGEPIALAEELPTVATPDIPLSYEKKPTAIRSFGGGPAGMTVGAGAHDDKLRRALLRDNPNATRCRTFHCKLADAALANLNDQINEWADGSDDIQIKFATSVIGVVEGKHADPHLIVTVFY